MDATTNRQSCFQFKANFSPCTMLQISRYDLAEIATQLQATISRAPNFFIGMPVVIDLELVKLNQDIDFQQLKKILKDNHLVPVGAKGGSEMQLQAAASADIPTVNIGKNSAVPETKEVEVSAPIPANVPTKANNTLITTPVRSGMHVYAKGGDLIITNSVSPGAEILADGNIHVYGHLRGRALAGVEGNTQARIFCRTLSAELVSIAGYYLVREDIQNPSANDSSVQVYLENEQIQIAAV